MKYTFHKSERLSELSLIEAIFRKEGQSIFKPPILFVYLERELKTSYPAQILISVPKRKFKHAHDRNRIKRMMRESYRLNKHKIYSVLEKDNKQMALALIYLSAEMASFAEIDQQINKAINEFVKRLS